MLKTFAYVEGFPMCYWEDRLNFAALIKAVFLHAALSLGVESVFDDGARTDRVSGSRTA